MICEGTVLQIGLIKKLCPKQFLKKEMSGEKITHKGSVYRKRLKIIKVTDNYLECIKCHKQLI